jgi:hypothetical protein
MSREGGLAVLNIRQSEAELEVRFSPRLWSLLHEVPRLYEALLTNLAPSQLSPGDFRTEGSGTVGGTALAFWLYGFNVNVTIKLDSFSVRCHSLRRVSKEQLIQVLDGIEKALQQATGTDFQILGSTTSYSGHAEVADVPSGDVIKRFVTATPTVEGFGASTGAGAAFYFAEAAPLIGSALTIDVSNVVSGGLFLRVVLTAAPVQSNAQLIDLVVDRVTGVFTALDLQEASPWS